MLGYVCSDHSYVGHIRKCMQYVHYMYKYTFNIDLIQSLHCVFDFMCCLYLAFPHQNADKRSVQQTLAKKQQVAKSHCVVHPH